MKDDQPDLNHYCLLLVGVIMVLLGLVICLGMGVVAII